MPPGAKWDAAKIAPSHLVLWHCATANTPGESVLRFSVLKAEERVDSGGKLQWWLDSDATGAFPRHLPPPSTETSNTALVMLGGCSPGRPEDHYRPDRGLLRVTVGPQATV